MFCEHPTCSLEANTICKYHCHLSVCQQHRIEHEKQLLNEFEKDLNELSNPISTLLEQYRLELKTSDQCRQHELDRINSLFDSHLISIDQHLKFSKTTNELILNKRKQLINYQNGDNQLTKEDYQQIQNLLKQTQNNLQQQYQLNNQICDTIDNKQLNNNNNIECIEISDSEDELSETSTNISVNTEEQSFSSNNTKIKINKNRQPNVVMIQGYCPLTEFGAFGLKSSHNLPRLCSKHNNKRRYLYLHLRTFHSIKSSLANKISKAVRDGHDPTKTKIFPQDNTKVTVENIQCPFDRNAIKFNRKNSIPKTPCKSSVNYHYFKNHLRNVHSITKLNANLIHKAMQTYGTISHVQFEEDLCEN